MEKDPLHLLLNEKGPFQCEDSVFHISKGVRDTTPF